MEKYFEIQNHSNLTKAILGAYQLYGKASTWWMNKKMEMVLDSMKLIWE
jgi:hypothetical protein